MTHTALAATNPHKDRAAQHADACIARLHAQSIPAATKQTPKTIIDVHKHSTELLGLLSITAAPGTFFLASPDATSCCCSSGLAAKPMAGRGAAGLAWTKLWPGQTAWSNGLVKPPLGPTSPPRSQVNRQDYFNC
jgi:hypothetical protein